MINISGYGLRVNMVASSTFPGGFSITQFSDDGDSLDITSIQINDAAMGLNGDLAVWSKANPIEVTINVFAESDDDTNLSILFSNNRVGKGKRSVNDVITATVIYPTGNTTTLIAGVITDGMPGNSVASEGRLKTKSYKFKFENVVFS